MSFRSLTATFTVAVLLLWGGAAAGPAQAAPAAGPLDFSLAEGTVAPKRSVPDSVEPIKIVFRFRARRTTPLSVRVVNLAKGRVVRRFVTGPLRPGRWHRLDWDGLDRRGRLVAAGKYRVLVGPVGGPLERLSRLKLFSHLFPIAGPHGTRGGVGQFGAGRNDGRIHEGFDATGACGTPLVAMRSGTILKRPTTRS